MYTYLSIITILPTLCELVGQGFYKHQLIDSQWILAERIHTQASTDS